MHNAPLLPILTADIVPQADAALLLCKHGRKISHLPFESTHVRCAGINTKPGFELFYDTMEYLQCVCISAAVTGSAGILNPVTGLKSVFSRTAA
jgi:hypothetical protein